MDFVPLSQAADPGVYGSKAANLCRAMNAGFTVPPGFVLSRDALRLFLESNRFADSVQAVLAAYERTTWSARAEQFDALCSAALKLPIPPPIRAAVEPPVVDLLSRSSAGLAVRSSAVCEDLARASFAGIYESILGVDRLGAFWPGVIRCWCSSWSPQAAAYARKMGLSLPVDGMAVLVQAMAPAESAGVIFTADPLSGDPWRFVLNSAFGLAEKLVDGAASADRFVLAWDTAEILEKRIERKPGRLLVEAGQVVEAALPEAQQRSASLSDEQAREVARLALALDRLFDARVDVEWAYADGRLWLLQARPLSALQPFFPHALTLEEAEETWTPYLNTYGNFSPSERLVAPVNWDRWNSALWSQFLEEDDVFPHGQFQERDFNGYRYYTPRRWGGRAADPLHTERWLDANEARLRRDWLEQIERVRRENQVLDAFLEQGGSAADWTRQLVRFIREERRMQAIVWYAPQWLIFTCEYLLEEFFKEVLPDLDASTRIPALLQGLFCRSVESTIAAQDLGRSTHEAFVAQAFARLPLAEVVPALARDHPDCRFLKDLDALLIEFGIEPPSGIRESRPVKDVDGVLLMIKTSLLADASARDARSVLRESVQRREQAVTELRAEIMQRAPDQLARFVKLLDWAIFWTPALDNRSMHLTMHLSCRMDALKARAGQALVAAGILDKPEHIVMLTLDEWAAYADRPDAAAARCIYEQRLHLYERNRRLEPLPYLGKPPEPQAAAVKKDQPAPAVAQPDARLYRGEGLAPGRARGIARKVADMDAAPYADQLTGDDILICGPESFRAEWRHHYYALFMLVKGLVTVRGAQLHHATQIARECGAPFINLPEGDFSAIPDGALVEIDGVAGTLQVL